MEAEDVWDTQLKAINKEIKGLDEKSKEINKQIEEIKNNTDNIRKLQLSDSQDRKSLEEELGLRIHPLKEKLEELDKKRETKQKEMAMTVVIIEGFTPEHTDVDESFTESDGDEDSRSSLDTSSTKTENPCSSSNSGQDFVIVRSTCDKRKSA